MVRADASIRDGGASYHVRRGFAGHSQGWLHDDAVLPESLVFLLLSLGEHPVDD